MKWQAYPKYKDSGIEQLGQIPVHWEARRLKTVSRFAYGDSLAADNRVPDGYNVFGSNGIVGQHNMANTQGPCLIVGRKGSFGKVVYSERPCFAIDTTYFVDASQTSNHLRWLFYCLQWLRLDSYSKDSAVPGLAREDAYENLIPYCLPDEQRAIAAFLDRKTAHIDALIAKKERQIELLQEKRAALISHAVTKGLDPDVPMKDSGVEWMGEIPAHWEIAQLRRVVAKFVDYRGHTPEKVESGVPLITARNIKNGHIDFSLSTEYMREDKYEDWMVRGWPKIGDVLITTEAPLGETAQVADTRIALAQRIILLKVNISRMINEYLKYHFLSAFGQGELWSRATGSTAIGIRADRFKDSLVAVPPLEEQEEIVHLLNNKITVLERPLQKIEQSIERLHEYRTALISAAVTGKIDVRNAEEQEVSE